MARWASAAPVWLLDDCEIVEDSGAVGRAAGVACARARTPDVVDGIVVVTAVSNFAGVVTSDPRDLSRIAAAMGRKLHLVMV